MMFLLLILEQAPMEQFMDDGDGDQSYSGESCWFSPRHHPLREGKKPELQY